MEVCVTVVISFIAPRFTKAHWLLENSKASPLCISGRSKMWMEQGTPTERIPTGEKLRYSTNPPLSATHISQGLCSGRL